MISTTNGLPAGAPRRPGEPRDRLAEGLSRRDHNDYYIDLNYLKPVSA